MAVYPQVGILHDIDKCVRCRGCVVACKRRSSLTPKTTDEFNDLVASTRADVVREDALMVVKSQQYFDMGPMVRYSCWHCYTPSCIQACPYSDWATPDTSAIRKLGPDDVANGAVIVQPANCHPYDGVCTGQCTTGCRGGGYPKIQDPLGVSHAETGFTTLYGSQKLMNKCDMCFDRIRDGKVPLCVQTCPADALKFDTMANLDAYIQGGMHDPNSNHHYAATTLGNKGNVIWASRLSYFGVPKSDPYIEDHMSQVVDKLMRGPFARLAMVPAGLALGLYALQKRKEAEAEEVCAG